MKTLLCTALVVLSVSVCSAQQALLLPILPHPPSPTCRIPLQAARPNSQAGPALCLNKNRSPRSQASSSQHPLEPNPKGNQVEPLDPLPTLPTVPGKKIE